MIRYEIESNKGKSPRIYREKHLDLAIKHAKECKGKVIDRHTNKIIFDGGSYDNQQYISRRSQTENGSGNDADAQTLSESGTMDK